MAKDLKDDFKDVQEYMDAEFANKPQVEVIPDVVEQTAVAPAEVAPMEVAPMITEPVTTVVSAYSNMTAFTDMYKIGRELSKTALVPQAYQNKPMDCAVAVDIANRMGLSPLTVMQNLYVVKGRPTWSGTTCMSMIMACKRYRNVKPVYVGKQGEDSWGCYISAIEAATGEEIKGTVVDIKMAKAEGWYGKPGSKWLTMPQQMLTYRAAAFFARVYCPSELMGFRVEGEPEDIEASKSKYAKGVDVYSGQ